jgi:hypothetical protein
MSEELSEKILTFLGSVSQARNREVARAVGIDKGEVDKAIAELAKRERSSIEVLAVLPTSPFQGRISLEIRGDRWYGERL